MFIAHSLIVKSNNTSPDEKFYVNTINENILRKKKN